MSPDDLKGILPDDADLAAHLSFESSETPKGPVPFVLWSAHDSTVAPYLATFGEAMAAETGQGVLKDFSFPPYATMLSIEVFPILTGSSFLEWNYFKF